MDAFLSERAPPDPSDAIAHAYADLHDLQHLALSLRRLRRHDWIFPLRMEEVCRR